MGGALTGMLGRTPSAPAAIDGTAGSVNAGILAAVHFTYNGSSVTVVGQKNVASVTRLTTGIFRVAYTSTLANANYGALLGGRMADGSASIVTGTPSRNTTSGRDSYTTSQIDVFFCDNVNAAKDIAFGTVIVYDPAAVGSDYLAAVYTTVSGTTPTVQRQTNVSSTPRQATGIYSPTFTSTLSNSDYSVYGASKFNAQANDAGVIVGQNRNTTGPRNRKTTALVDMDVGQYAASGTFDPSYFSVLAINADVAPRGTLAHVRFSYTGGTVTIIRSYNVASVSRTSAGLFRVTFTTGLSDTNYGTIASGKFPDAASDLAPLIGMNNTTTGSNNTKSTVAVDIAVYAILGTASDPEYVDLWVIKPWLM